MGEAFFFGGVLVGQEERSGGEEIWGHQATIRVGLPISRDGLEICCNNAGSPADSGASASGGKGHLRGGLTPDPPYPGSPLPSSPGVPCLEVATPSEGGGLQQHLETVQPDPGGGGHQKEVLG